jgi:hypothetical protein
MTDASSAEHRPVRITEAEAAQLRKTVNIQALELFLSQVPEFEAKRGLFLCAFYSDLTPASEVGDFETIEESSSCSAEEVGEPDDGEEFCLITMREPDDPKLAALWRKIEPVN